MDAIRINNMSEIINDKVCYFKNTSEDKPFYFLYHPEVGLGNLLNHTIEEHKDGTITVSPSIVISIGDATVHGFLEKGKWRDV